MVRKAIERVTPPPLPPDAYQKKTGKEVTGISAPREGMSIVEESGRYDLGFFNMFEKGLDNKRDVLVDIEHLLPLLKKVNRFIQRRSNQEIFLMALTIPELGHKRRKYFDMRSEFVTDFETLRVKLKDIHPIDSKLVSILVAARTQLIQDWRVEQHTIHEYKTLLERARIKKRFKKVVKSAESIKEFVTEVLRMIKDFKESFAEELQKRKKIQRIPDLLELFEDKTSNLPHKVKYLSRMIVRDGSDYVRLAENNLKALQEIYESIELIDSKMEVLERSRLVTGKIRGAA